MNKRKERLAQRKKNQRKEKTKNILITGGIILFIVAFIYILNKTTNTIETVTTQYPVPTDGLTIGDPNAPVLIEAYEDFQCPVCGLFNREHKQRIFDEFVYTGKARFTFKHYQFIGPESVSAANAAMCANDQGRFWDYHDTIFKNQSGENIGAFADGRLLDMADLLGLDMNTFKTCFRDDTYVDQIQADLAAGQEIGIRGTPTLVVNGVIQPDFSYETVAAAVNALLPAGQ